MPRHLLSITTPIPIRKEFMSTVPAHCLDSSSHVDTRAPSVTKIEGCKVEEVGSEDLGILPEFQGGNKGESIADGV